MKKEAITKKVVVEVDKVVGFKTTYEVGDLFLFHCPNYPLHNKLAYVEKITNSAYRFRSIPDFSEYDVCRGYEDKDGRDCNVPTYLGKFTRISESDVFPKIP